MYFCRRRGSEAGQNDMGSGQEGCRDSALGEVDCVPVSTIPPLRIETGNRDGRELFSFTMMGRKQKVLLSSAT